MVGQASNVANGRSRILDTVRPANVRMDEYSGRIFGPESLGVGKAFGLKKLSLYSRSFFPAIPTP
jgi:hypothetical protein